MNKKAGAGIWITLILGLIFVGLVITGLIIANQKGWFEPTTTQNPLIKFYIQARDEKLNSTEANYILDYDRNPPVLISQGILKKDEWLELEVPNNKLLHLYCWNDKNYLVKASKLFSPAEIQTNISKFTCDMSHKIGNLTISHKGNLKDLNNLIILNITAKDWAKKVSLCFSWSAGIVDVNLKNQVRICDSGDWLNWSYYNVTSKEYTYLDVGIYRCGDCPEGTCVLAEKCEKVEGNRCKLQRMEIPYRYKRKVDACNYLGRSINNESIEVELEVKSLDEKNLLDYIEIIVIDQDRRWLPDRSVGLWTTEENGKDIGIPDLIYRIEYGT